VRPGARARAALPARGVPDRVGRAADGLAHAPLQGGVAHHRRRGGRHPGDPGRAARRPDQAEVLPRALGRAEQADRARERGMSSAELWSGGQYELIAARFAEIHDALVERLAPRAGERWLDVATGTGEIALRAARSGADVTGLDIAPRLLEQARSKSSEVEWIEGDAQALPFADGAFDIVSSSFGLIFAPDQAAVAREVARVCRGRLGLTVWRPNEGPHAVYAAFSGEQPVWPSPDDWGRDERLQDLLGDAFELELEERVWWLEGESPEDVWELMSSGAPPVKALLDSLDSDRAGAFRAAMLEHWSQYQTPDGVREPRHYLLVLGTRR